MKIREGQEELYNQFRENNSKDPYSAGVLHFMDRWTDLMEKKIAAGCSVAEAAKSTEMEADDEGITGFMYGCAVNALASFWEHGEELRRWHNGEFNYSGDGVVNPAILTVAVKE